MVDENLQSSIFVDNVDSMTMVCYCLLDERCDLLHHDAS